MTKIKCENKLCRFRKDNNTCTKNKITITSNGCISSEKNIFYYISLVANELDKTNMIFPFKMTNELRIGLFYVMEFYDLKFTHNQWGHDEFFTLVEKESKKPLNYDEITKLPINEEKLEYHINMFNKGLLPPYDKKSEDKKEKPVVKVDYQEYGWLSPMGKFIKVDFGDHEAYAHKIVDEKKWNNEYKDWLKEINKSEYTFAYGDFLIQKKEICVNS